MTEVDDKGPLRVLPLHAFVGLEVTDLGDARARVTVPLTDNVRGLVAPLHGGVVATLADVACAAALVGTYDLAVEVPVSTELHVRFFGQPKQSPVVAEATVVHRGSRILGADCVISDGAGNQVARATGTYMIIRGFGHRA